MTQYQVTATNQGYVTATTFVFADSPQAAIDRAEMSMVNRHDNIRAELVRDDADDPMGDYNYAGSPLHY